MEAFDTNVVVRLLVRDDEDQCARAEAAWRRAVGGDGAWLSTVVLVETSWVLRVAYKFDRSTIAAALRRLVGSVRVSLEHPSLIEEALDAFADGDADFSDYVILRAAAHAEATPLVTFDETLGRTPGTRLC